ncbi:hypothetical protein TNCV_1954601 [Trichonephila clavipes]|nr:hypothetical protein TNCV_1954601 [Trichonephila clavipes]
MELEGNILRTPAPVVSAATPHKTFGPTDYEHVLGGCLVASGIEPRPSGDHLRICDRGMTCCTTDMEHKLSTHSRAEFDRLLRDTIGQVRTIFAAQAQRFDDNLVALHFKYDQARRRFVEWAQNEIAVVPDFHKRILFSDEAHFWLNGYVNKQNCRIWSEANPQVYVETPLHPEKLTVWCALWADGILLQKR